MTYNPNVPNAAQSPGLFPAQANANFNRLQTIIGADHVFNTTVATTDGIHKQVTTLNRTSPTALLAGTSGILYSKAFDGANEAYWYNGVTDRKVSGPAIFAAVNFDGTALALDNQPIRSSYTVLRVDRIVVGNYRVFFKQNLPNTDYIVQITGMRNLTNNVCYGCVKGAPAYGTSVAVNFIDISFHDHADDFQNVLMGNVVIYQIT